MRNHELAALISYAFHNPKKMPDYKASQPKKKTQASADYTVDDERVRAFFIGLSLKGK